MKIFTLFAKCKRAIAFLTVVFCLILKPQVSLGQTAASTTWNLISNANVSTVVGNITASTATAVGVNASSTPFDVTYGMRTYAWTTNNSRNTGQYYQFTTSPNVGNTLIVSSISFFTRAATTNSADSYTVYYSTDGFATSANIATGSIATASNQVNITGLNISVASGSTLSIRVYYYGANSTTSSNFAGIRTFVINGNTYQPPTITSFSPTSACVGAAQNVTITGTNLSNPTSVKFGSTSATIVSSNSTTIVATMPTSLTAGNYAIVVTTPGGTVTSATNFTVNALPIATILYSGSPFCTTLASVTPTITGTAGGTFSYTITSGGPTLNINTSTGVINPSLSSAGTYTITYSFSNGTCSNTTTTSVTINTAANISSQPSNQTTCAGTAKTFSVSLSAGTSPTYQWQYSADGVSGWSNVTNGIPANITYSGNTSSTLTVTPSASATTGTYYYQCVINVSGCSAVATNVVSFTVNALPTATISYSGSPLCSSLTSVTPTITGTTGGTFSYTVSSGGPTLSLNTSTGEINPSLSSAGTYTITYSFSNGSCSNTNTASVTVNTAPSITGQPANQSTCAGTFKIFSVTATGTTPTYQWQYSADGINGWGNVTNGTPANITYSGNLTSALTVTPSAAAGDGTYYYRCVITVNGCSVLNSNAASLQVYGKPTASAGSDQTVSCGTLTTTLAATTPTYGTGTWSVISGTGGSFGNVNSPTSTFTGTPAATYTLRWTATNGDCGSVSDDVTITFNYSLNGIYSVGASSVSGEQGHFTTLTRAVDNYNTCLSGNVTFVLTDATYNTNETFPIVIGNTAASSSKTLTIKPNTSVTSTITGSNSNAIIELNGADYVTIDGSTSGGTDQNLKIINTYSSTFAAVPVWIQSRSSSDGASNNTIKNCIIQGSSTTGSWAGIYSGDNSTILNQADFPNNTNTIQNCSFSNAVNGIYIYGANAKDQNWSITNNTVTSGYSAGIYIQYANNFFISGNTISGVNANAGINGNASGIEVSSNGTNFTISGNTISNIQNSGALLAGGTAGITIGTGAQTFTISTNTISNITNTAGIFSTNTNGIEIAGSAQSFTIQGNIISTLSSSANANPVAGIEITGSISGTNIISYNKLTDISNTYNFFGLVGGAQGMYLHASSTSSDLSVYNNFVSNVKAYGSSSAPGSTSNGCGILVSSGGGYKIDYNSINLQTNQSSSSGITAAICITSGVTASSSIELKDNIIANIQTTGTRYSIYSTASNSVFSSMDYNDYYSTGTNLAYRSGNNLASLAAIKLASGFGVTNNINSQNIQPAFTSPSDLHLVAASNVSLDNLGTPISGITDDIDITTRNTVAPDMGADEFDACGGTICTWIGVTNDDWNVGTNWCGGTVPTLTTDVYIPAVTPHDPKIYNNAANAKSVKINSSASLTTSGVYDLTIANGGTFTNNGTFDASGSTGAVIFNGSGTVNGTSSTTFNNITINGAITLSTAPTITGTFKINNGAVSVNSPTYTGTSTLLYNIAGSYITSNEWNAGAASTTGAGSGIPQNVTIQSGTVSIAASGGTADRALAGNLTIGSGATFTLSSTANHDLYVLGNWINNGGTLTANGRKVTLDASTGTQTVSGSTTFYDLALDNSGAITDFSTSTITINDEFRVKAGNMDAPGNTSTFIFDGSATTLEGTGSKYFYNLQINSGSTLSDLTASAGNTHIKNNFINNGTFNQNSSHTTFFDKSGATESMSGSGTITFGNLTIGTTAGIGSPTTLNASADFTVSGGSMSFFHSSTYNGSNNTATFSTNAATVSGSGTANFYNAITNVALNLGSGISNITNNLQINTGGSIVTNAPFYNSAATLTYNTTTASLPTSIEWTNNTSSTGSGAPYNVSVQNTNSVVIGGDRTIPGTLNLTAGNLDINSKTLTVANGFTGTGGNLKGSVTSNLIAGGTGTIYFNAAANYLKDFTINNGASLNLGSALNITASDGTNANTFGTLISNGGSLNAAGYLSLKSDANGTARVGYSTGSITGNVTVERYIPPRRAWRFLGVPFSSSSQTILNAWQEGATPYPTPNVTSYGSAPNIYNPNPGYGTEITYDNCTCNGYDVNITYNPSLKVWVNNAWSYYAPHTNTTLITDYNGAYCIFVRGSRAVDLSQGTGATADATVLRATGVLNQIGNINTSIDYSSVNPGDFLFIGNPYASSVDLAGVLNTGRSTGIDNNKFWLWDPKLNGSNRVGAYVTYDNGLMTPIGDSGSYSSATSIIQSGQAFMIQLSSGSTSANIKFKEDDKTATESNVFGKKAQAIHPAIYTNLINPANNGLVDGVAAGFGDKFSEKVDKDDAQKVFNFDENMELIRDNSKLAIEFRPPPKSRDTLFYKLYLAQHPYALQIFTQKFANLNLKAWLVDKYLNTQSEINLLDTTIYNFTPNPDTNSYRNRFMLVFKYINGKKPKANDHGNKAAMSDSKTFVSVYPNPVTGGRFNLVLSNLNADVYTLNLYTMSGDLIITKKVQHASGSSTYNIRVPAIAAGKYNIQLLDSNGNTVSSIPVIIDR